MISKNHIISIAISMFYRVLPAQVLGSFLGHVVSIVQVYKHGKTRRKGVTNNEYSRVKVMIKSQNLQNALSLCIKYHFTFK
jgi:hypothetical protein